MHNYYYYDPRRLIFRPEIVKTLNYNTTVIAFLAGTHYGQKWPKWPKGRKGLR